MLKIRFCLLNLADRICIISWLFVSSICLTAHFAKFSLLFPVFLLRPA